MSFRSAAALVSIAFVLLTIGCGTRLFGKHYEYEEDLYLSLDGSAEITINTSLPALKALRGVEVDSRLSQEDREKLRAVYRTPGTEVKRIGRPWTRNGRRFVQIRLAVDDVRTAPKLGPLSWSQ